MPGKNAVVKRIEKLTSVWQRFTDDPQRRLQIWRLGTDGGRLVDAFLAFHGEDCSELNDLFIPIVVPCRDEDSYWTDVLTEILKEIDDAQADFQSMDIPTGWEPPSDRDFKPPQRLVATLASFHDYYQDLFDHVGVVLLPSEIASAQIWTACLEQVISQGTSASAVRFLAVDWLPSAMLADWAIRHSEKVSVTTPKLDLAGLPMEMIAHLPGTGPGYEFRRLFVQLNSAAGSGQISQVQNLANRAVTIAESNGWYALAATVQLMLGGALCGNDEKVLEAYRAARRFAARVDDPSAAKISVTSAMAEAGCLLQQGNFGEARRVYMEAAREADEGAESMGSMDARRMASYCAECDGDFETALDDAKAAIRSASSLSHQVRSESTLPALLCRMEKIVERPELKAHHFNLERECEQLLGGRWSGIMNQTKGLFS